MTEEMKIEVIQFWGYHWRKNIHTPKQWLGRFRQNMKRKHKIDVAELIQGPKWHNLAGKTKWNTRRLYLGHRPEALYQMTRAEYKTEPDKIANKDLIQLFNEDFLPKWKVYCNRGEFVWTKQTETETSGDW